MNEIVKINSKQFSQLAYLIAKEAFFKHFSIVKEFKPLTETDPQMAKWILGLGGKITTEDPSKGKPAETDPYKWRKLYEGYEEPLPDNGEIIVPNRNPWEGLEDHQKMIALLMIVTAGIYALKAMNNYDYGDKAGSIRANIRSSFDKIDAFYKLKTPKSLDIIKSKYKKDLEILKEDRDNYIDSLSPKHLKELGKKLHSFNKAVKKDIESTMKQSNADKHSTKMIKRYFE